MQKKAVVVRGYIDWIQCVQKVDYLGKKLASDDQKPGEYSDMMHGHEYLKIWNFWMFVDPCATLSRRGK